MYIFFFNLTFQYILYFGRAKFVLPLTVLLGAVRPIVFSEVLGRPISVCHSKLCKYNQNDRSVKTQQYYIP
jgi:hypothetical protein